MCSIFDLLVVTQCILVAIITEGDDMWTRGGGDGGPTGDGDDMRVCTLGRYGNERQTLC